MNKTIISTNRKIAIAIVMFVFVVTAAACTTKSPIQSPDDFADIIVLSERLNISPEFNNKLKSMGITSMALIDKMGGTRIIDVKGTPINLCDPNSKVDKSDQRSCRWAMPLGTFLKFVGGFVGGVNFQNCGACNIDGGRTTCHMPENINEHMYYCPSPIEGECETDCEPL